MSHDFKTDVVVSGLGLVTPLGGSREITWSKLLQGISGLVPTPQGPKGIVWDFILDGTKSRVGDFALMAAEEALRHAGFDLHAIKGRNFGCAISQSKPILSHHGAPLCNLKKDVQDDLHLDGSAPTPLISSALDPQLLISSFSGWSAECVVKNAYSFSGPSGNGVAACATGLVSFQLALHWIQAGLCDVVLVGASESSLHPLYQSGFEQMGVLAKGSSPKAAKPFDRNRSGFFMGEGGAVLVLERLSEAQKRKHTPLARVKKVALGQATQDALHFDQSGKSISRLIQRLTSTPPDYMNAHGTGTRLNDVMEANGIQDAFGDKAKTIGISSTKAATGHMLGATGAVEAVFSVLALRDQIMPPTLNLDDPGFDLDFVARTARPKPLQTALSLSYGFGGQLGGVFFEKL